MPIYEYKCSACGELTEFMQKINEEPKTECPFCHAMALQRQISAVGFQLTGSGWYATDFKNQSKTKKDTSSETPPSSKEDKTKETKTNKSEDSK